MGKGILQLINKMMLENTICTITTNTACTLKDFNLIGLFLR